MGSIGLYVFLGVMVLLIFVVGFYIPFGLFISARFTGVRITIWDMIEMRIRRVEIKPIIDELIKAQKGGLTEVDLDGLESHHLANGNITKVVDALISAKNANLTNLTFDKARAIDLAGRDVYQAVRDYVNTKVISIKRIEGVARNGVQVFVDARVTVKPSPEDLIGSAGEETVLARIGQYIVGAIGKAENHEYIMANPDVIAQGLNINRLGENTAYEVLSVEIADVDLGENVGAKLRADEANANLRVARAKAEEDLSRAKADEQKFKARVQEMKSNLIQAEAQVPLAIADALRSGKMGVMDYLRLQNLQADTRMRDAFSQPEPEAPQRPDEE